VNSSSLKTNIAILTYPSMVDKFYLGTAFEVD